jgi:hypothetical protein
MEHPEVGVERHASQHEALAETARQAGDHEHGLVETVAGDLEPEVVVPLVDREHPLARLHVLQSLVPVLERGVVVLLLLSGVGGFLFFLAYAGGPCEHRQHEPAAASATPGGEAGSD